MNKRPSRTNIKRLPITTTIADLDGTIVQRWGTDWTPKPGPVSHADAIMSNQGGLALRLCGFRWAKRYPTWKQVLTRVRVGKVRSGAHIALLSIYHPKQRKSLLGILLWAVGYFLPPVHTKNGIFVSFSARTRKPNPGGLLWLCKKLDKSPRQCILLGDEDTDEEAARGAGMRFGRV